jgi:hypothetical protein
VVFALRDQISLGLAALLALAFVLAVI